MMMMVVVVEVVMMMIVKAAAKHEIQEVNESAGQSQAVAQEEHHGP